MKRLDVNHPLFQRLIDDPPQWWKKLKSDPMLYIDVRKNNAINVYFNGGSIMKLEGTKTGFKAQIHVEYIPLNRASDYLAYHFHDENIFLSQISTIDVNNFEEDALTKIKNRVSKFYPNNSEKGIQGRYVINNNKKSSNNTGFFIDTEFQNTDGRIDMVWVDIRNNLIAMVELKTIGDQRLYIDRSQAGETIDIQLAKYNKFTCTNKQALIEYYDKVLHIKKGLGILPEFAEEDSLKGYALVEKPILIIGDCTQRWIDQNAATINKQLKDIAFGCLYQGINTFNFAIPYKTTRNRYRFDYLQEGINENYNP